MSRLLLLGVLVPVATGCVGNIQRSARVPHPSVPLSSGQPLATQGELSAGFSNVADVVAPEVGNDTQAVEVPGTQLRSELRLRLGPHTHLGLIYEHGLGATSQVPDPTQAPVGDGDVQGAGVSLGHAFATSTPGLVIGTTVEAMAWSVPFVEYETCTNCVTPFTVVDHGRANPATLGLGVAPSYRSGTVTVFGGAFARNHPTTQRKELNTDITFNDNGDVENGPFNLLLHAGVEVELARRLSALLLVHQNVIADPVQYGPGFAIALTGRLGD